MDRKLSVKKERLVELTSEELAGVAGAEPDAVSLPLKTCALQTIQGCTTNIYCPKQQD